MKNCLILLDRFMMDTLNSTRRNNDQDKHARISSKWSYLWRSYILSERYSMNMRIFLDKSILLGDIWIDSTVGWMRWWSILIHHWNVICTVIRCRLIVIIIILFMIRCHWIIISWMMLISVRIRRRRMIVIIGHISWCHRRIIILTGRWIIHGWMSWLLRRIIWNAWWEICNVEMRIDFSFTWNLRSQQFKYPSKSLTSENEFAARAMSLFDNKSFSYSTFRTNGNEYSTWLITIGWDDKYSFASDDGKMKSSIILVKIDEENSWLMNEYFPLIKSVKIDSNSFSCFR